jgi:hypothetical protein
VIRRDKYRLDWQWGQTLYQQTMPLHHKPLPVRANKLNLLPHTAVVWLH